MQSLDSIVQFVIPEIPGGTTDEVKAKLREALRRFCMETESWTQKIELDTVADQAQYDVLPEGDAKIKRVVSVKLKANDDDAFDQIIALDGFQYDVDTTGYGITFITGYETPDTRTDGMEVKIALLPTITCESVDTDLLDRYAEAIYSLAKHLLMRMPGKIFYNPDMATFYFDEYRRFAGTATREKYTENKQQDMVVIQLGGRL